MTATLTPSVGTGTRRVEAIAKVTGQAQYSAEIPFAERAYGYVVQSTIARGTIRSVGADPVRQLPGVLAVLTHENAPELHEGDGETLLFQADAVRYRGEPIGLVVATSLEQARAAAELLRIDYAEQAHDVVLRIDHPDMYTPEKVNPNFPSETVSGDVDAALGKARFTVDQTYQTPAEHNNPMEPHAATAVWDGGDLTVYDSNQGAASVQQALAKLFGLAPESVRVVNEHVGGGFGAKGSIRPPAILAAMAALVVDRPVTISLTRQQMFAMVGYRTPTIQQIRLGADEQGRLVAVDHLAYSQTSRLLEFAEQTAVISRSLYATPNLRTGHRLLALDVPSPRWMRGPGETPGSFALESAMNELAEASGIDPVELRIRNDAEREPDSGLPFSSRSLVECLREGATRFGWVDRDPAPGVTREGRWLLGSGVATSTYPARSAPSTAKVSVLPDGRFVVEITAADIGTGARTALTQVAADELRADAAHVEVRIGDSDFGPAMIAGGSMGTASWSWAVVKACRELRDQLIATPNEPLSVRVDTTDDIANQGEYARHAFGAQFAGVRVDTATGEVQVDRLVGVFAAGRIVNPTAARSQFLGGMTMGIGMALHEESVMDVQFGDYLNHDLAGYHVPVNADIREIDVGWVEEYDEHLNPLGIKGIGELGIVGTAAAIAGAIWHATGVRHRVLPIRPDRVLLAGG
ncbi:MAG: xanthine dehydrogenase family protein molybdopterin-binding subunit [Actinomycetota bacterium]|nr:xanthine dehydrogenase family protein molybdopterin-binding subunit [Actinomycetota bacterium]